MKKKTYLITVFILIIFNSLRADNNNEELINLQIRKLKYILEVAQKFHKDSIDIINACDNAFMKLLNSFDPNSEYYPKSIMAKINERNQGVTVGIGIDFAYLNDSITIVSIAKSSPAEEMNLNIGDKILEIEGQDIKNLKREEILNLINGDTNTILNIKIKKFWDDEVKTFSFSRKEYESYSINSYFMLNKEVAYVSLNRFSDLLSKEFKKVAEIFAKSNAKKIILDLRGNMGGYLGRAIEIADYFLKKPHNICTTLSKNEQFREVFNATDGQVFENLPLIVLVDSNSASGSEVIAASIQDNDRGLIIGMPTYGKATAQKMYNMIDSTAFRITVAEYITPLGRKIHKDKKQVKIDFDELTSNNINKQVIEEIVNKYGGKPTVDIYTTPKGRILFSFGGIYPDIYVKADSITPLTSVLRKRGIYLEWALNYLKNEQQIFLKKYNSFEKYLDSFVINDSLLNNFREYSLKKKVWNDDMFLKDKELIKNHLKSVIAYIVWGPNESSRISIELDIFVKTALENFDEAEKLFKN